MHTIHDDTEDTYTADLSTLLSRQGEAYTSLYRGTNYGNQKETIKTMNLICFDLVGDADFTELVSVRWYMGRSRSAQTVLCTIWVSGRTVCGSGSGRAGGYGYCKISAAFSDACDKLGIDINRPISGCGREPVRRAIDAIAEAVLRVDGRETSAFPTYLCEVG